MLVIVVMYMVAAMFNLCIPDTGARYPKQEHAARQADHRFRRLLVALWRDKLGQISLAVTTLFWGAGATLQFIVLRMGAKCRSALSLSQAAMLQAVIAVGVAVGAILAAARVPLKRSLSVLPVGIVDGHRGDADGVLRARPVSLRIGASMGDMHVPGYLLVAYVFLMIVGGLSGFFVVPMNALLQHRGHVLLSAGHSIAVQNFNENLSVLVMLCLYAVLVWLDVPIQFVIVLFGSFVCLMMYFVMRRHQANQRAFDSVALIGEARH